MQIKSTLAAGLTQPLTDGEYGSYPVPTRGEQQPAAVKEQPALQEPETGVPTRSFSGSHTEGGAAQASILSARERQVIDILFEDRRSDQDEAGFRLYSPQRPRPAVIIGNFLDVRG